ncbi:hypothetical protein DEO72_LG5g2119 [Vigna unguiculata]|uniref:Uncharacterized protein n=1 Tax=Vigna unguiculata TaxID=3917 RepID=A0A4D6M0G3_VIGUN|nr:hypothetical protein DEO72_LG5g2119 [Vigna unguiculata]
MPGLVPKYEYSSQRPKTTKLVSQLLRRAIYLDPSVLATTSTLTPATLTNLSHNSKVPHVHPPSRAITQEMLFRATTEGIPHALTPIPSYNSRDISRLQNQQPKVATAKIAWRGTHAAKRTTPLIQPRCRYRLVKSLSPPSAHGSAVPCWEAIAWRNYSCRQAHAIQAHNPVTPGSIIMNQFSQKTSSDPQFPLSQAKLLPLRWRLTASPVLQSGALVLRIPEFCTAPARVQFSPALT